MAILSAVARAALVSLVGGCFGAQSTLCANGGVCPPGLQCIAVGGEDLCAVATCGDGVLDPQEACDDGNHLDRDGCPADCQSLCGNGVMDRAETCDDGNEAGGDGCSADCNSDESCGNGIRDVGIAEPCDDGNHRDNDGCSSRCVAEHVQWTELGARPPRRAGHSLVYDARRGKVVLFGGCAIDHSHCDAMFMMLGDTWEWDGNEWTERAVAQAPLPRFGHAMTYDWKRGVTVLHGGCQYAVATGACGFVFPDTWEWDGEAWREVSTENTFARYDHALSYDPVARHALLVGGSTLMMGSGPRSVAGWDGTSWQQFSDGPPNRARLGIAYEPTTGDTIVFGGRTATAAGDTWRWTGTAWVESPPELRGRFGHAMAYSSERRTTLVHDGCFETPPQDAMTGAYDCDMLAANELYAGPPWVNVAVAGGPDVPSPRNGHAMVEDVARRRMVMFGGADFTTILDDTWEIVADRWLRRSPIGAPNNLEGAVAYDARRRRAVFFSELDGATWEWDGAWHSVTMTEPNMPGALDGVALAYDAARGTTILFGGRSGLFAADTWEWTGESWRYREPAHRPPPRMGHALAYDPVRRTIVLYGGTDADGRLGDTWIWDGLDWSPVTGAGPPARAFHAMTYDAARDRVLVFGGRTVNQTVGELWAFDGQTWQQIVASGPSARTDAAMVYDPLRQRVLVFGGTDGTLLRQDTWEWDGTAWSELTLVPTPSPRRAAPSFFDMTLRGIVVAGGSNATGTLRDTWLLRSQPATAMTTEGCGTGFDADGDGLVGCDDPDCLAACDPVCASLGACSDPTRPRCGDGTCSGAETCRLCPSDCGACDLCGDTFCDAGETAASCPGDCS